MRVVVTHMFSFGFQQHSGRVISLGRFVLAALFLVAIWLDASQPVQGATQTYGLLGAYVLIALTVAVLTWKDWWLDAKLAAPAHLFDIGMFTILVFATEGYTSPFFLFFVFLLLSAAIRWGWRETAMTAAAVIILYLSAGLLVAASAPAEFELQRFIIRSGHLFILSAILIWFGINQRSARFAGPLAKFAQPSPDEPPLETALAAALRTARASRGVLVWRDNVGGKPLTLSVRNGDNAVEAGAPRLIRRDPDRGPFLYRLRSNRALAREPSRRLVVARASDWLDAEAASQLELSEGLAIPVRTDTGEGVLLLEAVESLSMDHLELGEQLSREVADHFRRHALLRAVEESGEARARLSLARDLHDSVVQFLAGATFRIQAMMRHAKSGASVEPELEEMKRLMLQEQEDLRSFIGAMRSGREMRLDQLADELDLLAQKLARHWNVDCAFSYDKDERMLPMRLHLDAQQLVREAVANAVRHGHSTAVHIHLSANEEVLRLTLQDNGRGFPGRGDGPGADDIRPRSLQERARDAGGELMLQTEERGTSLTFTLPIRGRRS